MVLSTTELKTYLENIVAEDPTKDIPVSEILESVSLPVEKFTEPYKDKVENVKVGISLLIKFTILQAELSTIFEWTNHLLLILSSTNPHLKAESAELLINWKGRIEDAPAEELIKIANTSNDIEEKINQELVIVVLKKANFPNDIKSWEIAVKFLERHNRIISDEILMKNSATFLLAMEYKDLQLEEKVQLLIILASTISKETSKSLLDPLLLKVVATELDILEKEKRSASLLILRSIDVGIYNTNNLLPVECLRYLSNQETSAYILNQASAMKYAIDVLTFSADPIYISGTSGLFRNPPDGPFDAAMTSTIINLLVTKGISAENSFYSNLLYAVDLKSTDGHFSVNEESFNALLKAISDSKQSTEHIKHFLNALTLIGKNKSNFAFDAAKAINLAGDLGSNLIKSSSNEGKNLPDVNLIVDYLIELKTYISLGYILSAELYQQIYGFLTITEFPRTEIEREEVICFLSVALDKIKFAKDIANWDIAMASQKLDPKGVLLLSIVNNIELDQLASITMILTALSPTNFLSTEYMEYMLDSTKEHRSHLAELLEKLKSGERETLDKERKTIILTNIVERQIISPIAMKLVYTNRTYLDYEDLKMISPYVRNKKQIVHLCAVEKFFEKVVDKGEVYERGYGDLFDIHKALIERFPFDVSKTPQLAQEMSEIWPKNWGMFVTYGLENPGAYKASDGTSFGVERIQFAVELLLLIPMKGDKELDIDKWDHIQELLNSALTAENTEKDLKDKIQKVFDRIR